jgi:hypothetical protein
MHPWYLPPPFNVAQVIRGDAAARAVPQGGIEKIVNFFLRQFALGLSNEPAVLTKIVQSDLVEIKAKNGVHERRRDINR